MVRDRIEADAENLRKQLHHTRGYAAQHAIVWLPSDATQRTPESTIAFATNATEGTEVIPNAGK